MLTGVRLWTTGCCLLLLVEAALAQTSYNNRWDARQPAPIVKPTLHTTSVPTQKDTATSVVLTTIEGETITMVCLPVFLGGHPAFVDYVDKKLKKPKGPRQRGTVQVTFTVLTSGAVSGAHVKPGNGLSPAYDAALLEVISNMPPLFHPGGCNGNSKAMEVTYPYVFD